MKIKRIILSSTKIATGIIPLILGVGYHPLIQVIGTGNITIPVTLNKASLGNDELLVSGCISEAFTTPLKVVLMVERGNNKFFSDSVMINPNHPFFVFKAKSGKAILNLLDDTNTFLTIEKASLSFVPERLFIFDLEPESLP